MVLLFLDYHPKSKELERRPMCPHGFPHEQFEGTFRCLKLVTLTFTLLQGVDQFPYLGVALVQFDSVGLDLLEQPAPPCRIRYQHTLAVPNQPRNHMFIGRGIFQHRMDMDPTLVGKRRITNIRLMRIGHEVRDLGHESRDPLEMAQAVFQSRTFHLQFKIGNNRTEIRIAAPFADPVNRPLHLHHPGFDRHQRIRDGHFAIVVGVNPQGHRALPPNDLADLFDFPGHRPAIGVAENHPLGPGRNGMTNRLQSVVRIVLVSVKEMFRIVKHPPAF